MRPPIPRRRKRPEAQQRRQAGKAEKGTIRLSAYHQGGHIIIEISDDGRGLDEARIFQIAHAYEQSTDWHKQRPKL